MRLFCILLLLCTFSFGFAQDHDGPYLAVQTADADIPLKSSKTDVQISGTIAHVRLTQVYHNSGKRPIVAKYVFPLSVRAAVHKMRMTIGDRSVNAKIFERQEAKKVYDEALRQGKRAAKLDQDRPNVFKMNLGNIMPGDEIAIDIFYTEMLAPLDGKYQFVAPAVVGPRFTGERARNNADQARLQGGEIGGVIQNDERSGNKMGYAPGKSGENSFHVPYLAQGNANSFDYDICVTLNAGMLIQDITSGSHDIDIHYPDAKTAEIALSKNDDHLANRDFILDYSLRANHIQSGLLLYEHKDENFFALQMEPMKSVRPEEIPAREYLFVVDVSGSMNGYPLEVSKTLMRNLLCNLRPSDTFNVQLFASSSTVFVPEPVQANEQNIMAAIRFLSEGQGGGGTRLLSALNAAYALPRKNPQSARSMVIITDGYVSVEKEAFELIRDHLDRANVFTFGIGSSVNRYLIEGMAKVANSQAFIATTRDNAAKVAEKFRAYIATPLLTQVKLESKGFEIYDMAPGSIPDVFAARPVTVYGKYRGKPTGSLIISGIQGDKKVRQEYKVSDGLLSRSNRALRYLWARKRIERLDDYRKLFNEDVKDSVIALGLKYSLATQYTSFVAVDEAVVNKNGGLKTVSQPLSMPRNVSNSAVGAEAEIEEASRFKKPFRIVFMDGTSASEKRRLTMAFNALYFEIAEKYLIEHQNIRIHFDVTGRITGVDKRVSGRWTQDKDMTRAFAEFSARRMSLPQGVTLILTRS